MCFPRRTGKRWYISFATRASKNGRQPRRSSEAFFFSLCSSIRSFSITSCPSTMSAGRVYSSRSTISGRYSWPWPRTRARGKSTALSMPWTNAIPNRKRSYCISSEPPFGAGLPRQTSKYSSRVDQIKTYAGSWKFYAQGSSFFFSKKARYRSVHRGEDSGPRKEELHTQDPNASQRHSQRKSRRHFPLGWLSMRGAQGCGLERRHPVLTRHAQRASFALRKLLDTALEQKTETDKDLIRRILSFVAVCLRPLSVLELSDACQLHPDEDDTETRAQFTREYIASCGQMVIIQDGEVLLLHDSVRDYLGGAGTSHSNELKAHAALAPAPNASNTPNEPATASETPLGRPATTPPRRGPGKYRGQRRRWIRLRRLPGPAQASRRKRPTAGGRGLGCRSRGR